MSDIFNVVSRSATVRALRKKLAFRKNPCSNNKGVSNDSSKTPCVSYSLNQPVMDSGPYVRPVADQVLLSSVEGKFISCLFEPFVFLLLLSLA